MVKVFLAILLLATPVCFSQDSAADLKTADSSATLRALANAQHFLDSMKMANNLQGLNNLLQLQKEQKQKQQKKVFLYIGLGIVFLLVFVAGILRKTKTRAVK
jgi:hypothetical protein